MKKCVFFDRDGVVNRSPGPGYVERWADFKLMPEFVDVLGKVTELGYGAVVVTNQRGVKLGVVSEAALSDMHDNLKKVLREKHGLKLLDIMVCPHDDNECDCRKPKPGMLLEAARKHGIDLKASWMIGDGVRDVEAGRRAGCRTVFIGTRDKGADADYCVADMAELVEKIENILG